jgi:CheY-like chemotaxis protein
VAFCDGLAHTCGAVAAAGSVNSLAHAMPRAARILHNSRCMRSETDFSTTLKGAPPLRVLVVEDDPDILEMLVMALSSHGLEVTRARHGGEALTLLREAETLPQLILLDLRMRGGLGGAEFVLEQRADPALAAIPVVIMTAVGVEEQRATGLEVAGWLCKPLRLHDLFATIAASMAPGHVDRPAGA